MRRPGRRPPIVTAALLALAAVPGPLRGQADEPEVVPKELVEALVGPLPTSDRERPDVLVGELPAGVAGVVPPSAGARVVGSLVFPSRSVSAFRLPGTPEAAWNAWSAHLLDAGWTRPELPERPGFAPSRRRDARFCMGDSTLLTLTAARRPAGGSWVRVDRLTGDASGACRIERLQARAREGRLRQSPIPSLLPPEGSTSRGGGTGGGAGRWEADARLRTDLPPTRLLEHYTMQLRDHGWEPLDRAVVGRTAVETFRWVDPEGVEWQGVLVVTSPGDGPTASLSLQLLRVVWP